MRNFGYPNNTKVRKCYRWYDKYFDGWNVNNTYMNQKRYEQRKIMLRLKTVTKKTEGDQNLTRSHEKE